MNDLLLEWAIWIAAISAAVGYLLRSLRIIWRMARNVEDLVEVVELMVNGNGGGTLLDRINKLEAHWANDAVMRIERERDEDE